MASSFALPSLQSNIAESIYRDYLLTDIEKTKTQKPEAQALSYSVDITEISISIHRLAQTKIRSIKDDVVNMQKRCGEVSAVLKEKTVLVAPSLHTNIAESYYRCCQLQDIREAMSRDCFRSDLSEDTFEFSIAIERLAQTNISSIKDDVIELNEQWKNLKAIPAERRSRVSSYYALYLELPGHLDALEELITKKKDCRLLDFSEHFRKFFSLIYDLTQCNIEEIQGPAENLQKRCFLLDALFKKKCLISLNMRLDKFSKEIDEMEDEDFFLKKTKITSTYETLGKELDELGQQSVSGLNDEEITSMRKLSDEVIEKLTSVRESIEEGFTAAYKEMGKIAGASSFSRTIAHIQMFLARISF